MESSPYLTFDGNCEQALGFYAATLGGTFELVTRFGDMPGTDVAPQDRDRVGHARLLKDGKLVLMASDSWPGQHQGIQGFSMQTGWDDVETARDFFLRISDGGEVVMDFAETFWAKGFGLCRDRFGVGWMVNCDTETA